MIVMIVAEQYGVDVRQGLEGDSGRPHAPWAGEGERTRPFRTSVQERLAFRFRGASNLHRPGAPHMRRVIVTFIDNDHFTETWTKSQNGKDTVFDLQFVRR
jgi:hypothetical protein